ncbi:MAG: hypothetical protein U1D30_24605 [Planctomycetota bacterium]
MDETSNPNPADLIGEERQIRACRWGFLLLAAGLLLVLLVGLFLNFPEEPTNEQRISQEMRVQPPGPESLVANAVIVAFTMLPGGIILAKNSRSRRWRSAAYTLLSLVVADILMTLVLAAYLNPQAVREDSVPHWYRTLELANGLLMWPQAWFMVVLVAEFGLSSRATRLVHDTERLGFVILAAGTLNVLFAGWILPMNHIIGNRESVDTVTFLLGTAYALLALVGTFWTIRELASAATLARLLSERSQAFRHQGDDSSNEA